MIALVGYANAFWNMLVLFKNLSKQQKIYRTWLLLFPFFFFKFNVRGSLGIFVFSEDI